jgi:hypothetical protein
MLADKMARQWAAIERAMNFANHNPAFVHGHCGDGARYRRGFALVQHSKFESSSKHRRFEP